MADQAFFWRVGLVYNNAIRLNKYQHGAAIMKRPHFPMA
jgi:hypothetical protein